MDAPTTSIATLLLTVAGIALWGLWINTFPKRRFEWYTLDFAIGLLLISTIGALTIGLFLTDINAYDSITIIRKTQIGYSGLAGMTVAFGVYFMMAGVAVSGAAYAMPVAISLGSAFGAVWVASLFSRMPKSPLMYPGLGVVVAGVALASYGFAKYLASKPLPAQEGRNKPKPQSPIKGILLSVIAGPFLAGFAPLSDRGRIGPIETNVYLLIFLFSLGFLGIVFVCSLYFINLPIQGQPLEVFSFFKGGFKPHTSGLSAGMLWGCGAICVALARSATGAAVLNSTVAAAFSPAVILLCAISGFVLRKEFSDASGTPKMLLLAGILIMIVGAAMAGPFGFSRVLGA